MPTLRRHDDVFILDIGETENRFHPDWLAELEVALDEVAGADGPRALVTTASGRFFSNGLDLDWLETHADQYGDYLGRVHALLARVLALPVITVAALPGHAFAAGAMLSLAHDFRVMRSDRGFWCLPEVDIEIPFTRAMSSLIRTRLPPQTAHEAMTTGRRYGGLDASAAGIVHHAVPEDAVLPTALAIAAAHTDKAGPTLAVIKQRMDEATLDLLGAGPE